jgi:hypothetical protein
MAEAKTGRRSHPAHGWGRLAENPWLDIAPLDAEQREVMRRIWWRQGGSDEMFEFLMSARPSSSPPGDASLDRR